MGMLTVVKENVSQREESLVASQKKPSPAIV